MRLLSKTTCILRCSSLSCAFTVSLAHRLSKICHFPVHISFVNTFKSWRHGGYNNNNNPRFLMWNVFTRNEQRNQCTVITADGDGELSNGEFTDVEYITEKTRLYRNHDCELINQVLAASSFEEILKFDHVLDSMDLKLASQTVVTLNELQKSICPRQGDEYLAALQDVQSSSVFQRCLEILENEFDELLDCALLDVFLALRRNVSTEHVLFTKCLIKCQELIPHLPPKDLKKFCIIMLKSGNSYLPLIAPVIGKMSVHIQDCKTDEDIRNLATCLGGGTMFASSNCLTRFAKQVEAFILSGKELEFLTVINCLTVLINADQQLNSIQLQQLLISFLIGFVPKLNAREIRLMFQNISYAKCNTDSIVTAIEQRISILLKENLNLNEMILLLNCVSRHDNSLEFKYLVNNCIKRLPDLYDVRQPFQISLMMGTVYNIFPLQNKDLSLHLLKLCCKDSVPVISLKRIAKELLYLRIMSGFAMTGENVQQFTDLCLYLAENSVKCQDIVLFSSFVIAYLNPTVPVKFIQRLNSLLLQLNVRTLSFLSLSLSITSGYSYSVSEAQRKELAVLCSNLLKILIGMIPSCKNLTEYNAVLKCISSIFSHTSSKGQFEGAAVDSSLFKDYSRFLENTNFEKVNIISTCKMISRQRICLPHVLDAVAQCIVEHPSTQSVKTVSCALQACYSVNYSPQVHDFLFKSQDLIVSENQLLSCKGLLQAASCLGLNGALNDQLIHLIFCEEFLEKLEKEISVCSIFHARGIRMALARLNKSVCLDCPEENVPWFHEQYYKNLALNAYPELNEFEKEVYKVLCQVLPGKEFIQTKVYTPYHYLISFQLLLDKLNSPLEIAKQGCSFQETSRLGIERVAVDVLPESQYCRNMPRLTGYAALKKRHLEILGYKLVQVPFFEWNSLHLSSNESRVDYLNRKIFQSI